MKSFVESKKKKKNGSLIVQKEAKEIAPFDLERAEEVIFRVRKKEGVVLNFDEMSVETAQRMLDFISGAVYVLGGTVKKIKDKKYLLIPQNVKINKVREDK